MVRLISRSRELIPARDKGSTRCAMIAPACFDSHFVSLPVKFSLGRIVSSFVARFDYYYRRHVKFPVYPRVTSECLSIR
jgi:hypothetical protein